MYESFYGLKAKPFHLSPDPRFFFGSRGHKRVLAYLRYGITQGDGFIVVTGGIGTGKTTLVRTLQEELAENKQIIGTQLVSTQLDPTELLQMVASSFDLPHEGLSKTAVLKHLEGFLEQRAREGKRVLLIVDEVQNLPPESLEELRMLSNFQADNRPLFQSFLLGQAEFRDILNSEHFEQLRQRVIASYHLGSMYLDETRGYIEHRLRLVGWKQDPKFTTDAYRAIYNYTGGVPRRINTLCDRIFLVGYLDEIHVITEDTVKKVIKELQEESSLPPSNAVSSDVRFSPLGSSSDKSFDVRLKDLESRVGKIENIMAKLRDLLKASFSGKR